MNEVLNLNESYLEEFKDYDGYNRGGWYQVYPIDSYAVSHYEALRMPLPALVTRADGKSTCRCGAVYTGFQGRCKKMVWRSKTSWHWALGISKDSNVQVQMQPCGEVPTWDKAAEFEAIQKKTSLIADIVNRNLLEDNSYLKDLSDDLPFGKEVIENRMLRSKVAELQMQINSLQAGMEEVASRLQSAGMVLSFGAR